MKINVSFYWLGWLMLTSCHHPPKASTAYNVAGSYDLLAYHTPTMTDNHPSGTIEITQEDADHINIQIQAVSGKTTLKFTYSQVVVLDIGQNNLAEDCYNLLYQGHSIGVASNDGTSRYLELNPSSIITLNAIDI